MPGGWELVLVLLVIVVVFGSKRLPDTARSLGRSMRILKAETRGLRDDDDTTATTATTTTTAANGAAAPVAAAAPAPAHLVSVSQTYQGQPLFDALGRPVQLAADLNAAPPAEHNPAAQG